MKMEILGIGTEKVILVVYYLAVLLPTFLLLKKSKKANWFKALILGFELLVPFLIAQYFAYKGVNTDGPYLEYSDWYPLASMVQIASAVFSFFLSLILFIFFVAKTGFKKELLYIIIILGLSGLMQGYLILMEIFQGFTAIFNYFN